MLTKPKFSYVRLDRDVQKDLNPKINSEDYKNGFKIFGKIEKKKIAIISHGKIFHDCTSAFNKNKYFLINLFRSKPFPEKLVKKIRTIEKFLVVDEQTP